MSESFGECGCATAARDRRATRSLDESPRTKLIGLPLRAQRREPIRAHVIQIAILTNHLNGKDTHIRGVRIFAPRQAEMVDGLMPFTSNVFKQHETIR